MSFLSAKLICVFVCLRARVVLFTECCWMGGLALLSLHSAIRSFCVCGVPCIRLCRVLCVCAGEVRYGDYIRLWGYSTYANKVRFVGRPRPGTHHEPFAT